MARPQCGRHFPLRDDGEILQINSPQDKVGGPYVVVVKSLAERWAIVAMEWENAPCLGIRWFWERNGYPHAFDWGTWLVNARSLSEILRPGLPLEAGCRRMLEDFLAGRIPGDRLRRALDPAIVTLCWNRI